LLRFRTPAQFAGQSGSIPVPERPEPRFDLLALSFGIVIEQSVDDSVEALVTDFTPFQPALHCS
jgi:hypothetical protein